MGKQLDVDYDPEGDVLYISFGPPQPAVSDEVEPGVYLRRDPDTDEIVGVTVIDFSKRGHKPLPVVVETMARAD